MKTLVGAMAVFTLAGCVSDFEENPADFTNGCKRDALMFSSQNDMDPVQIPLDTKAVMADVPREPMCIKINSGDVKFILAGSGDPCRLLGGQSNGVEAMSVDESSPLVKPSVHELSQGSSFTVFLEGPGVYGFFCEQRPDVAGAVFVESM